MKVYLIVLVIIEKKKKGGRKNRTKGFSEKTIGFLLESYF